MHHLIYQTPSLSFSLTPLPHSLSASLIRSLARPRLLCDSFQFRTGYYPFYVKKMNKIHIRCALNTQSWCGSFSHHIWIESIENELIRIHTCAPTESMLLQSRCVDPSSDYFAFWWIERESDGISKHSNVNQMKHDSIIETQFQLTH